MTRYTYTVAVEMDDNNPAAKVSVTSEAGTIRADLDALVGRDGHAGACDLGSVILAAVASEHYGKEPAQDRTMMVTISIPVTMTYDETEPPSESDLTQDAWENFINHPAMNPARAHSEDLKMYLDHIRPA